MVALKIVEHGKGVDLAIHESFQTPQQLVELYNQPPQLAWRACCEFHTSPEAFAKIMSTIQPWHTVAFQFFNDKGRPNPTSEQIENGRWVPAFRAQDEMLERYMKAFGLEDLDWRPAMYRELDE